MRCATTLTPAWISSSGRPSRRATRSRPSPRPSRCTCLSRPPSPTTVSTARTPRPISSRASATPPSASRTASARGRRWRSSRSGSTASSRVSRPRGRQSSTRRRRCAVRKSNSAHNGAQCSTWGSWPSAACSPSVVPWCCTSGGIVAAATSRSAWWPITCRSRRPSCRRAWSAPCWMSAQTWKTLCPRCWTWHGAACWKLKRKRSRGSWASAAPLTSSTGSSPTMSCCAPTRTYS